MRWIGGAERNRHANILLDPRTRIRTKGKLRSHLFSVSQSEKLGRYYAILYYEFRRSQHNRGAFLARARSLHFFTDSPPVDSGVLVQYFETTGNKRDFRGRAKLTENDDERQRMRGAKKKRKGKEVERKEAARKCKESGGEAYNTHHPDANCTTIIHSYIKPML